MLSHRLLGGVAGAALLLGCSDPGEVNAAPTEKTLMFSAIPDDRETLLREKYTPVAAYLADKLGIEVRYVHANRYADVVEHFKSGDVQLAWFGGLTGVQARHAVPGARAIAKGAADAEFHSYFIAHKDAGIEPSETFPVRLAGVRFTFGAANSTSGRLMPEYFIRQHTGKSPAEFFGMPNNYAGDHHKVITLVTAGAFAAGVCNYAKYDRMVADGEIDPEVCRVVWRTPAYTDYNFTAHPVLATMFGDDFIDKLQRVLVEMDDARLLGAFDRKRFVAATNAEFESIAKLARDLGFIRG